MRASDLSVSLGAKKMSANGNRLAPTDRLRELIAEKLKEAGKSHRWAARKLKVSHATISNVLAGRSILRVDHLHLFARALGTTPAALLAEADGESTQIAQLKLHLVLQYVMAAIQVAEDAMSHEPRAEAAMFPVTQDLPGVKRQ